MNLTNEIKFTNDKGEKVNTYIISKRTYKGTQITFIS